jgi:hypothetical protein
LKATGNKSWKEIAATLGKHPGQVKARYKDLQNSNKAQPAKEHTNEGNDDNSTEPARKAGRQNRGTEKRPKGGKEEVHVDDDKGKYVEPDEVWSYEEVRIFSCSLDQVPFTDEIYQLSALHH